MTYSDSPGDVKIAYSHTDQFQQAASEYIVSGNQKHQAPMLIRDSFFSTIKRKERLSFVEDQGNLIEHFDMFIKNQLMTSFRSTMGYTDMHTQLKKGKIIKSIAFE